MGRVRTYSDEGIDDLLHGELKLIQKRRGYRYSVDALLLCHFVLPVAGERVIDLGCAGGVIPLILAKRSTPEQVVGVEIQVSLAGMARRNVRLNRLEDKVQILHRDMKNLPDIFPASSFDCVVSNPPFIRRGSGQLSAIREKAMARHELKIDLYRLVRLSRYLVRPGGRVCFIYPVARLEEVKASLKKAGLYPSRIQLAFDRPGGKPRLFCIEAKNTRSKRLKKMKPIIIETKRGKFAL
jgi:tRNA1Val (adenine37-N6)-methyltransferase